MLGRIVFIQILCLKSSFTFEIPSNCWIGNDKVRVDLLCPDYVGDGRTSCCGDPATRFCCTKEQFEEDARTQEKAITMEIIEENVVILKSDNMKNKTIKYGEVKIHSEDMNIDLEGFSIKVKKFI